MIKISEEKIREKITKLLRKANNYACPPKEAESARALAKALGDKYGVYASFPKPKVEDLLEEIEGLEIQLNNKWISSILSNPDIIRHCNRWECFSAENWLHLLMELPELENKCDKFDEFSATQWRYLLIQQAQFVQKCNKWNEFSSRDWDRLLKIHPNFERYKNL